MARPTPEPIDDLFRGQVRQACAMTPDEKLLAGPRLLDNGCQAFLARLQEAFPSMDERAANEILGICVNRVFD